MAHPIEDIIVHCKAGDRLAQRRLYDQFSNFAMGICYRYATDISEAKDMVQNTFVRIFQHIHDYDSTKGTFTTWLHRIAVHEAIAVKRKKQRWNLSESALAITELPYNSDVLDQITIEELRSIIDKLPESHRIILMLYYFDGFNHTEIAQLLSIEISSSRAKLSRAKSELTYHWNLIQQIGI
jgi:RNA polymerase sigma factor (sigma-70 family)